MDRNSVLDGGTMLDLSAIREALHKIPEPAYKEYKTKEYILSVLQSLPGLKFHFLLDTAMVVEYTVNTGPYLLFRADMDALPIDELTQAPYQSQNPGFMHACGHDIHMTVLIGIIEQVATTNPSHNILFLFQPAEEGFGGAEQVLGTGFFKDYTIRAAFSLHVSGNYPVGTVATKPGIFFAIPQEFKVLYKGQSAHAAFPEKGKDALAAGISFYQLMQSLVLKSFPATDTVIFHIGKMQAGNMCNALASSCLMEGTARMLTKDNRGKMNHLIQTAAESTAQAFGLEVEVTFPSTYDPVMNHPDLYSLFKETLPEGVQFEEASTVMTGEDFGFFTSIYPGLLYWLGVGGTHDLHSAYFLPDPRSIEVAISISVQLIEQFEKNVTTIQ